MDWDLERKSQIGPKCILVGTDLTIEGIKRATNELPKDKAPGPDGFSMVFFQEDWETIKDDL